MGNVMVDVNHVSIRFIQNQEKVDNLKEYFIKLVTRKLRYDDFWALTDVNFQIEKGERLGVLGFNGAGKSRAFSSPPRARSRQRALLPLCSSSARALT
jgi:ABC-2 type transport system ATP-binding protein